MRQDSHNIDDRHPTTRAAVHVSATSSVKLRVAAVLLLLQGVLMEGGVFLALPVLLALGVDQAAVSDHFQFIVPYLQDHLFLMMVMSGIFGTLRIFGAVGMLRNRLWGLSLSVINCIVTLTLMIFLLPAGIADGVLSGTALVLILMAWFGDRPLSAKPLGPQSD